MCLWVHLSPAASPQMRLSQDCRQLPLPSLSVHTCCFPPGGQHGQVHYLNIPPCLSAPPPPSWVLNSRYWTQLGEPGGSLKIGSHWIKPGKWQPISSTRLLLHYCGARQTLSQVTQQLIQWVYLDLHILRRWCRAK